MPAIASLRLSVAVDAGAQELLAGMPAYAGEPSVVVNGDTPLFVRDGSAALDFVVGGGDSDELSLDHPGVRFSELDALERCGAAVGILGPETLTFDPRDSIGAIKPSGWHTARYDDRIDDGYLYNRCHLIGYQLCGVNAEPRNLVTGTRYLNVEGMLPLENATREFIQATGCHVLYRATPLFNGGNLLAAGVLLEAWSMEDSGAGLQFCRFAYNVQPGVIISYATGDSQADEAYVVPPDSEEARTSVVESTDTLSESQEGQPEATAMNPTESPVAALPEEPAVQPNYVLNTNTMKFHLPDCPSATDMSPNNRRDFFGTRSEVVAMGYEPCGRCQP